MPVVPRRGLGYTPTTATPSLNPAGAFTPPTPVNLGPAADRLREDVERNQQTADNASLLEADNQLFDVSTGLKESVLAREGKNAIGAGPGEQDEWNKAVANIGAGLNNRIQDQFQARAAHQFSMLNGVIQEHVRQQTEKYSTDQTDAFLQNSMKRAIDGYTDPRMIGQSVAESRQVLSNYAELHGWSPDQLQAKTTDATSKIHTGVIDRMLTDGNDITAQTYFDAHKGEMTSEDILRVEKPLEIGSTLGKAQRDRNAILSTTTNEADAVIAARKIENPREQAETERLIKQDYIEKAAALRDQKEQTMTSAAGIIESTHSFEAIPPSTIATMTVQERSALREYADKLAGGSFIKTDLPTYDRLETMSSVPETRDKFLQLDLNTYKSKLDPADFKHFSELQASVRKGEDKPIFGEESKHGIVTDVLKQAGIGINKKGKVLDAGLVGSFRLAVDKQVNLLHEQTGRVPGPEDVTRIANEMAAKHVVSRPGFWSIFGTTNNENVRTFQMQSGEQVLDMTIKDVPSSAKLQIRAALQQRGKAVTDQAVVDAYRAYVQTLPPQE